MALPSGRLGAIVTSSSCKCCLFIPKSWVCHKSEKSFMLMEAVNANYLLLNLSLYADLVLMLHNPFVSLPLALF